MRALITQIRKYGLEFTGRYYGIYMSIVLDNSEFSDRGKLTVKPVDATGTRATSLICFQKGLVSEGMGVHWVPRKGDVVWVEFRKGNPGKAYWTDSFYAKGEKKDTMGTDDIGFQFPDGSFVKNNHKDSILTIHHKQGWDIVIDNEGVHVNGDKTLGLTKAGLKYQSEPLLKGPASQSELSLLADMVKVISTGLNATQGAAVVPALEALLQTYKANLDNLYTT